MVVCCYTQETLTQLTKSDLPQANRLSGGIGDSGDTDPPSHEIGVDVMEYKLPRSEKTVDDFGLLLEEHLSPREKELIDQRRRTDSNDPGNLLDGLLQIWTFKESIIKALGIGLRMELSSVSLSNLISHPEVNWDPIETGSAAATRQEDFILPDRSSQIVVSINGQEDRSWKIWNAVWARPDSMGAEGKYILSAAIRSFCPQNLSSTTPLIHPVMFKTVSDLLPPR